MPDTLPGHSTSCHYLLYCTEAKWTAGETATLHDLLHVGLLCYRRETTMFSTVIRAATTTPAAVQGSVSKKRSAVTAGLPDASSLGAAVEWVVPGEPQNVYPMKLLLS